MVEFGLKLTHRLYSKMERKDYEKIRAGYRYFHCATCNKIIKTDPDDYILDNAKYYCNKIKCHKQATNGKLKK